MRTFERRHKGSIWVWDIDLTGRQLTVIHGKRDKPGKVIRHDYASSAQAEKEYSRRIREKLRESYVETTPPGGGPPTNVRESLEAALAANPDDVGTHMAYADYLQEQGDRRGQLIQLQLALEDEGRSADERHKLRRREQFLLHAHERSWLGALAPFVLDVDSRCGFQFQRGWLDTLHVPFLSIDLARALVCSPQVRLVRRLVIQSCKCEQTGSKPEAEDLPRYQRYPATYVLARSPFLTNLRVLQFGSEQQRAAPYPGGSALVELLPRLLRLEELRLKVSGIDGDQLFGTPLPPTLRILHVDGVGINDDALGLARSGLLKHLTVLALWDARLTDVGAGNLARRLPSPQLELLDLSHNQLTFAGTETLRATGVNLVADNQQAPRPRPRYDLDPSEDIME